jgi:outer membrane protein assembly factor BamB
MKNKFNSAVLYKGYIYGLDEGILACVDVESGELKWKGGRYGYGQLLLSSGHLVVLTEEGDVVLVRAAPEKLQEVARFSAIQGKTWNIPAISDGLLLVRNEVEMAAFRIAAD